MKDLLKNPFFKFILIFSGLSVLWFSFYHNIYQFDKLFSTETNQVDIQKSISIWLAHFSNFFVQVFGYEPTLDFSSEFVITSVEGTYFNHGVWIGEPCNGIKVFGLFTIFIVAFPGPWKKKLWFIPLGILIVQTANAIRIALLTIISAENPTALDFNHNITFQVIVYGLIFFLWWWWVQKLSGISIKKEKTSPTFTEKNEEKTENKQNTK